MQGPAQLHIRVFIDNQAGLDFASNPIQPGRNLHLHARYFAMRDLKHFGILQPTKLGTDDQIADILVSFKGAANFLRLYGRTIGCAYVWVDTAGVPTWDDTLLI